jgi:hypothetical protein
MVKLGELLLPLFLFRPKWIKPKSRRHHPPRHGLPDEVELSMVQHYSQNLGIHPNGRKKSLVLAIAREPFPPLYCSIGEP